MKRIALSPLLLATSVQAELDSLDWPSSGTMKTPAEARL
jgi:hypothetical protein